MIKKILIGLGIVVLALVVVVAMQPEDFRITRSTTIDAPASTVFPHVNDFRKWQGWSPWAAMDPNAKITFEGPEAGNGAVFKWAGNEQVGEGIQTIVESRPNELVKIQLDFIKPFEGKSMAEFTFKPEGDKTLVSWSMYGKNNFIGKAFSLAMNCDKMIGGEFEKGLGSLKSVVEKSR